MTPELDDGLLHVGNNVEKALCLVLRAEAHHALDAGAIVPAAIEDHDLAAGRQVRQVTLNVHLRLLALGRCRQRDHAKDARADAGGHGLDGATLSGSVASLEDDADLLAFVTHPFLKLYQLHVQLGSSAS